MFKGVFYHCEGPDADIVKNKTQCLELSGNGNKWVNHKYNFDNLGQALMSLFVLSSKDGWVNIMYSGLDAVGIDQQVRSINRTKIFSDVSHLIKLLADDVWKKRDEGRPGGGFHIKKTVIPIPRN